ncbi:hypothetical protein EW146_g8320 [Bondarzewia mesenterica]|uniref:Uncharacterized protein n=1 Tax=Bondarzewia mesenterica TaxID=1095465 RepID=A0A4S4LH48_9AGAM|nr:hypothetical protein EW146_g8320 [Bondarzewia mesenterica]
MVTDENQGDVSAKKHKAVTLPLQEISDVITDINKMPKNAQEVNLPQAISASQELAVNSADGDKDMRQEVNIEDDRRDVSELEPQMPTRPRKKKPSKKALTKAQDLSVCSVKQWTVLADELPIASSSKQSDRD